MYGTAALYLCSGQEHVGPFLKWMASVEIYFNIVPVDTTKKYINVSRTIENSFIKTWDSLNSTNGNFSADIFNKLNTVFTTAFKWS